MEARLQAWERRVSGSIFRPSLVVAGLISSVSVKPFGGVHGKQLVACFQAATFILQSSNSCQPAMTQPDRICQKMALFDILVRAVCWCEQRRQRPANRPRPRWQQRQRTAVESPAQSACAWTARLALPGLLRQARFLHSSVNSAVLM